MSFYDNEYTPFSIYSLLEDGEEQQQGASNDNFNIDTSMKNDDQQQQQGGQQPQDGEIDDQPVDGENGGEQGGDGQQAPPPQDGQELPPEEIEEPNEDNTEMFFALSKEEQQIKITMLKAQYQQLYSSCDDLITRIDDLNTGESNIITVSRLSETINSLKTYMRDYIIHIFPIKSFVENDIMLNRFLDIINTITVTFNKLENKIEKENNKNDI